MLFARADPIKTPPACGSGGHPRRRRPACCFPDAPSQPYEPLEPRLLPTVLKVALALVPMVVIAVMHTTMIRASMTAYSTAVGPSSRLTKLTTAWEKRDSIAVI